MRTLIMKQKGNELVTSERFTTVNKSLVDVLLCKNKIK